MKYDSPVSIILRSAVILPMHMFWEVIIPNSTDFLSSHSSNPNAVILLY